MQSQVPTYEARLAPLKCTREWGRNGGWRGDKRLCSTAAWLRRARSAAQGHGMSVSELAVSIGAAKEEILLYEAGTRYPEAPRIKQLAEALGIAPLDLADPGGKDDWTLADLRRLNGYRVRDLSGELGLSPRTYSRLERDGVISQRRFALVPQIADRLGVSVAEVERLIGKAPVVQQRLSSVRPLLHAVFDSYTQASCLKIPSSDDSNVRAIASLYARPAAILAALLGQETARIRDLLRRRASFAVTADFGATADEQADARKGVEAQTARIQRIISLLPQRLDTFFRCMLPSEHWRALAHLSLVATTVGGPLTPAQLKTPADILASMPPHLITALPDTAQDAREYEISEDGIQHHAAYRSWYDALYPSVRTFVQTRDIRTSGHLRRSELRQRFTAAETVLLSFDGLLCRLFTANLQSVSDDLVQVAQSLQLPLASQTPTDPVGMLRALVRQGTPSKIRRLDRILASYETEAAQRAEPLPGVSQLLRLMSRGDWRMAVVTDHASGAVEAFLTHLAPVIDADRLGVFGRPVDPRMMKPHPHGVALATRALGSDRSRTILLGESVADFLAAQAAACAVHRSGIHSTPAASAPRGRGDQHRGQCPGPGVSAGPDATDRPVTGPKPCLNTAPAPPQGSLSLRPLYFLQGAARLDRLRVRHTERPGCDLLDLRQQQPCPVRFPARVCHAAEPVLGRQRRGMLHAKNPFAGREHQQELLLRRIVFTQVVKNAGEVVARR